jgi:cytochrome c
MRSRLSLISVALLAVVVVGSITTGCNRDRNAAMAASGQGDPDRGKTAILKHGCGSCHTIPGIRGADALVGPSLEKIGERTYVGGVLENNQQNLVAWIMNPPAVDPNTAMPNIHVPEADARDIAGYLYTLK